MDKEDIINLAREAGLADSNGVVHAFYQLERFAALVAEQEREACARVCDEKVNAEYATGKVDHHEMAWTQACAIAIRARGQA